VLAAFVIAQIGATVIAMYLIRSLSFFSFLFFLNKCSLGLNGYPHDGVADVRGCGPAWALAIWVS
jgi:hypothetical protein